MLEDNATVTADAQLVREFEVNEASVAAQIRNGAAARSDIAAAQFQTAQAKGNLVTAQGTAIGAQATFATTLGLDADAMVVPKSLSAQPTAPNPSYALSLKRALLMRPDYISAAYNVFSARDNLRYAKLARFPILSAAATDGVTRQFVDCFSTTETLKNGNVVPFCALSRSRQLDQRQVDRAAALRFRSTIKARRTITSRSQPRSSIRRSRIST